MLCFNFEKPWGLTLYQFWNVSVFLSMYWPLHSSLLTEMTEASKSQNNDLKFSTKTKTKGGTLYQFWKVLVLVLNFESFFVTCLPESANKKGMQRAALRLRQRHFKIDTKSVLSTLRHSKLIQSPSFRVKMFKILHCAEKFVDALVLQGPLLI